MTFTPNSDPANAGGPSSGNPGRFQAWRNSTDQYDHTQLAQNWDRLDAIIGRPANNAAWPPKLGSAGGIFAQINLLMQDRVPIGTVIDWWFPFTTITTAAEIASKVPSGWAICDGREVTSHDFGTGSPATFYTPDLRNVFVLGAQKDVTPGTVGAGTSSVYVDEPSGAPGIVVTENASNTRIGAGGKNALKDIKVALPDHFHYHDHVHMYGSLNSEKDTVNDTLAEADPRQSGSSTAEYTRSSHEHRVRRASTSQPRHPQDPNKYRYAESGSTPRMGSTSKTDGTSGQVITQTSLQVIAGNYNKANNPSHETRVRPLPQADGTANETIPGTYTTNPVQSSELTSRIIDAATGNNIPDIDTRPRYVGLLKIMKVKYATAANDTLIVPT